jgi:hypothetical protein
MCVQWRIPPLRRLDGRDVGISSSTIAASSDLLGGCSREEILLFCAFSWLGHSLALSLTGVSYRFGNVCHINHKNNIQDFWGPLLAFSAAALLLQLFTLAYCMKVYLKNLVDDKPTTDTSSALPSYSGSVRTVQTARAAYRRVRKVIQLQWRGVAVVLLVIADVIFFAVVFVTMDNGSQVNAGDTQKALPWLTCLVLSGGQKNECLPHAKDVVERESVVLAVLILIGVSVTVVAYARFMF